MAILMSIIRRLWVPILLLQQVLNSSMYTIVPDVNLISDGYSAALAFNSTVLGANSTAKDASRVNYTQAGASASPLSSTGSKLAGANEIGAFTDQF